ncbi:MAG TPA: response regulator [Stellaceae bacterium]|nr:response regulator [Stellaceae bacterium]
MSGTDNGGFPSSPSEAAVSLSGERGPPVNILLVDDQPAKLLSYETVLRDLGENLIRAGSASEALEHLLKNEVAVILIDVCMPDLDGFELAAMIRGHPRFQATAMMFVSAVALTELDRLRGYEYGAVDYVPVPIVPGVLRAKVRVFADLYRKSRQLKVLNSELEERVAARTAELAQANAELERRVEERTREREAALAQVHEMQKLESLGQLTGGLAHDFNNLLMGILSNMDLLAKRVPRDPLTKHLIDGAIKSAERGANLTKRMLAFARRQELKPKPVAVAALINDMGEMLRRTLGPTIEIRMDFPPDLPLVGVDPNQLELGLLNLALNARDAMPDGGQLTFAARHEATPKGMPNLPAGDYVRVSVADTGAGMDKTTLLRAPEPFFTTKGVGKGTGLGLSMVYGLTAQSGGGARISSEPGKGTTVELWFPIVTSEASDKTVESRDQETRSRPLSILIVDDDPLVLESTVDMIEDLGHRAYAAASGALALDTLRSGVQIDLILSDHAMPGMTGVELAKHAQQLAPGIPIILATGYTEDLDEAGRSLTRLSKPYRQSAIAALITTLIGPHAAANVISLDDARRA